MLLDDEHRSQREVERGQDLGHLMEQYVWRHCVWVEIALRRAARYSYTYKHVVYIMSGLLMIPISAK